MIPFWDASAGEAIWCYKRMFGERALSYPRGGAHRIPSVFCEAAEGLGADLRNVDLAAEQRGDEAVRLHLRLDPVHVVSDAGEALEIGADIVACLPLRDRQLVGQSKG